MNSEKLVELYEKSLEKEVDKVQTMSQSERYKSRLSFYTMDKKPEKKEVKK